MLIGQNPLICLQTKKSDKVDITNPIYHHCKNTYGAHKADSILDELKMLQVLRDQIVGQTGSAQAYKSQYIKYFRGLLGLELRIVIGKEKQNAKISFVWYDAFKSSKRANLTSIKLEKAAILFNLASVCSQIGTSVLRIDDEGVKEACKNFQEAAGFLDAVKNLQMERTATLDLSSECCEFLSLLMLAQAQECFYVKAHLDGKSASVMAMIAKQASILYQEVKQLYNQQNYQGYFDKDWGVNISVRIVMWKAESFRQSSLSFDETTAIGSKICRLRECKALLKGIKKDAQSASAELAEQFSLVRSKVSEDLSQAEKDNNTVYLSRITLCEELPTIKPAPLAKPISPDFTTSSKEEEWFSNLVPDQCAKALVKYNKLVDDIVGDVKQKVEQFNNISVTKLADSELPMLLDALKPGSKAGLSIKTKDQIQEFQDIGGIGYVKSLLSQIAELRKACEDQVNACEDKLAWEVQEDRKHRERYGKKWKCPPSNSANKALSDKISNCRTSLLAGSESDQNTISKLQQCEDDGLQTVLSPSNLAKTWPLLQPRQLDLDSTSIREEAEKIVTEMKTLEKERNGLSGAIEKLQKSDDILPLLMKQNGLYDDLFEHELKYADIRQDVETSCERTQVLILQLEQKTNKFNSIFQISKWKQACELVAQNVEKHVANYQQIRDILQQSLESYQSLLETCRKLYISCEEYVQSRLQEADKNIQDLRSLDAKENEVPQNGSSKKGKGGCYIL